MFCRLYQSAIQNDLDEFGKILRPTLIHHLKKCSCCRAFYHRIHDLETQLRTEPTLHIEEEQVQRIAAAVRRQLEENPRPQKTVLHSRFVSPFRMFYGVTAAAAMLMICLLGVYYFNRKQPPLSEARFVTRTASLQSNVTLLARFPEKSLEDQIQTLTGDARTAVQFIADCIPGLPVELTPKPQTDDSAQ